MFVHDNTNALPTSKYTFKIQKFPIWTQGIYIRVGIQLNTSVMLSPTLWTHPELCVYLLGSL